jgi:mono/diheme cytochrome c family protein
MATLLVPPVASAADAESGRRLAESRCVTCHVVVTDQRKEVADAPPFDAIARKLDTGPDVLAFLLLHPHPRMNVMITRREAEDLAAYISTLAR